MAMPAMEHVIIKQSSINVWKCEGRGVVYVRVCACKEGGVIIRLLICHSAYTPALRLEWPTTINDQATRQIIVGS
jgi:hypothetical protein